MLHNNYLMSISHLLRNGYSISISGSERFILNKLGEPVITMSEVQLQFIFDNFNFLKEEFPLYSIYKLVPKEVDISINQSSNK